MGEGDPRPPTQGCETDVGRDTLGRMVRWIRRVLLSIGVFLLWSAVPPACGEVPRGAAGPDLSRLVAARDGRVDEQTRVVAERWSTELSAEELSYLVTMRWQRLESDPDALFRDPVWVRAIELARTVPKPHAQRDVIEWARGSVAHAQSCRGSVQPVIQGIGRIAAGATLAALCGPGALLCARSPCAAAFSLKTLFKKYTSSRC